MSLAIAVLAALAVAPQDPEAVRPGPVDATTSGITRVAPRDGPPDRIVALDFAIDEDPHSARLPLARGVSDVDVAAYPDGSFAILAGGVREDLDIYRFDPRAHLVERYPTVGGRRLAASFCSGLGSHPLLLGAGLSMFAFEKENAIRFRAATSKRTVAERTLPLSCEGFRASFDRSSYLVQVEFVDRRGAVIDRCEFLHPIAPRLVVEGVVGGAVTFDPTPPGETQLHALILHDEGASPLQLGFSIEGPFALEPEPDPSVSIAPGAGQELRIRFVGGEVGEHVGTLRIRSPVAGVPVEFGLRAQVVVPAKPVAPTRPSPEAAPPTSRVEGSTAEPAPVASVPPVPAPRLDPESEVEFRWRDAEHVLVDFRLAADDSVPGAVQIVELRSGRSVTVPVDPLRKVSAVVAAMAFDPLAIRVGSKGSQALLGRVPPALRLAGGKVAIHAAPDANFVLVQITAGGDPRRLIGRGPCWQGRTDARGMAQIDIALLAVDSDTRCFAVVAADPQGGTTMSEPIEIGPSTPPSGGDRAK